MVKFTNSNLIYAESVEVYTINNDAFRLLATIKYTKIQTYCLNSLYRMSVML